MRTLPCCARFLSPCRGRIEANHAGVKPGFALKCSDFETLPKCSKHHRQWTEHAGVFEGWTKAFRRAWADENIAYTQRLFADSHREAGLPVPAAA
ncbi:MAG: hypothetical protein ABUR63_00365 [Verrucomicrobiota bacterium]